MGRKPNAMECTSRRTAPVNLQDSKGTKDRDRTKNGLETHVVNMSPKSQTPSRVWMTERAACLHRAFIKEKSG